MTEHIFEIRFKVYATEGSDESGDMKIVRSAAIEFLHDISHRSYDLEFKETSK
jgi:hypothetical protein